MTNLPLAKAHWNCGNRSCSPDPICHFVICNLSLSHGISRDSARLDDDEGLLAVSVENNHHWTTRIELLGDFLKIFGAGNRLIVDCLDYIAGLQLLGKLRGGIDTHDKDPLSILGYICLRPQLGV